MARSELRDGHLDRQNQAPATASSSGQGQGQGWNRGTPWALLVSVVVLVLSIMGGTWTLSESLGNINLEIQKLRTDLRHRTLDRWTGTMEKMLWLEVHKDNPDIIPPDVQSIKESANPKQP